MTINVSSQRVPCPELAVRAAATLFHPWSVNDLPMASILRVAGVPHADAVLVLILREAQLQDIHLTCAGPLCQGANEDWPLEGGCARSPAILRRHWAPLAGDYCACALLG